MSETPAQWYADPYGRFELRYWDGERWTDHVSTNGATSADPVAGLPSPVAATGTVDPAKVAQQVAKAGIDPSATPAGGGSLLDQPVLVVNQKAKLIELTNQYSVYDKDGQKVGAVTEVGQSKAKKALRLVSNLDSFMTHSYHVLDLDSSVILQITRPRAVLKSTVVVADGAGREIGRIRQENMIGKIRFAFESGDGRVGSLNAENWRAWNFNVQDETGTEVARITKTWEGLAKAAFTTADNYVVQIHRPLQDPLRSLVVASALTVDTVLKQNDA
jgi:uncharacterized protein YxjI